MGPDPVPNPHRGVGLVVRSDVRIADRQHSNELMRLVAAASKKAKHTRTASSVLLFTLLIDCCDFAGGLAVVVAGGINGAWRLGHHLFHRGNNHRNAGKRHCY